MGSDESYFIISFIVGEQSHNQCPWTTIFEEKWELKRGIEPTSSAYQPDALH